MPSRAETFFKKFLGTEMTSSGAQTQAAVQKGPDGRFQVHVHAENEAGSVTGATTGDARNLPPFRMDSVVTNGRGAVVTGTLSNHEAHRRAREARQVRRSQ